MNKEFFGVIVLFLIFHVEGKGSLIPLLRRKI